VGHVHWEGRSILKKSLGALGFLDDPLALRQPTRDITGIADPRLTFERLPCLGRGVSCWLLSLVPAGLRLNFWSPENEKPILGNRNVAGTGLGRYDAVEELEGMGEGRYTRLTRL